ncbi:sugar translocase [Pseudomonas sp. BRG-100]|uniref:GtrA family protein n=1 Tax=unclassified Pseudomonas TaxID=196821 RepID=UPI0004E6FE21|nr:MULTISPECIES: GtrA family protein [unclassified Pseudomonas]KFF43851.1 sugar translocase [Pseudomonas sp. BRG-100]QUW65924.1 GtrA family protein [Pseudomonas synxantha]UEH09536.1 GtrA family protein [Pseudomonas sp. HN8-3]
MARLWKGFTRYTVIGVANTVIHWQLFFMLRAGFEFSQALSNLLAFCVAASFSFYVNALFTFDMPVSLGRYLLFMTCMGVLSLGVGWLGDHLHMPGLITVLVFSLFSLLCGFLLSRWVVFRERGQ